jgi:lipoyl synthase
LQMGFKYVASGPLVRSSYRAAEAFLKGILRIAAHTERAPFTDRYGKQPRRLTVVT